jgi:hypothetical protein
MSLSYGAFDPCLPHLPSVPSKGGDDVSKVLFLSSPSPLGEDRDGVIQSIDPII